MHIGVAAAVPHFQSHSLVVGLSLALAKYGGMAIRNNNSNNEV